MVGEVTSLRHEALDDSVEARAGKRIAHVVVASTERPEVFSRLRNVILVQLKLQPTDVLAVLRDLHEDLRIALITIARNTSAAEDPSKNHSLLEQCRPHHRAHQFHSSQHY